MSVRVATCRDTDSKRGGQSLGGHVEWPVDTVGELRDR